MKPTKTYYNMQNKNLTEVDIKKLQADALQKIIDKAKKRKENIIEQFTNLKPIPDEDHIPLLPMCDKDTYDNVVVPNLIRCGAIPIDKLVVGKTYIGDCRNASEAVWNGKQFVYERHKFGDVFEEKINHFQEDDGFDLFVPIKMKEDDTEA